MHFNYSRKIVGFALSIIMEFASPPKNMKIVIKF